MLEVRRLLVKNTVAGIANIGHQGAARMVQVDVLMASEQVLQWDLKLVVFVGTRTNALIV